MILCPLAYMFKSNKKSGSSIFCIDMLIISFRKIKKLLIFISKFENSFFKIIDEKIIYTSCFFDIQSIC